MSEVKMPDDLLEAYADYSNPHRSGLDNQVVIALIKRIARVEDALVTLAQQHSQSGETIARLEAMLYMAVVRLGGEVEGAPTQPLNFLQRIDELRAIEAERNALKTISHEDACRLSQEFNRNTNGIPGTYRLVQETRINECLKNLISSTVGK